MSDVITFSPPILDYGKIFVTGHPQVTNVAISNHYTKDVCLVFKKMTDSFYFIKTKPIQMNQINTGFDIFSVYPKINSLVLPANSTKNITFVCKIPSDQWKEKKVVSGDILVECYLIDTDSGSDYDDIEFEECDEEVSWKTINIPYKVETILPNIEIMPPVVFLDDCCKNQPVTTSFSVKNLSEISLNLNTFIPEHIELISQTKNVNYIDLAPGEETKLEVKHLPTHTGQYDYKVLLATSNGLRPPFEFKINTSVSPAKLPADFPSVSPNALDFGNMRANETQELTCSISNPSNEDYTVTICSYSDFTTTPLLFKTALKSQQEPTTKIVLNSQSSRTIFISYTPKPSDYGVKGSFEKRSFVITMMFTLSRTGANFFKRVPVTSNICYSLIDVKPDAINFGDMQVSRNPKQATFTLSNVSGMSTTVSVSSTNRWVVLSSPKVELEPFQKVNYSFSFYPLKISPNFHASIVFKNDYSADNQKSVKVTAVVLASNDEVIHSNYYTIVSDQKAVNMLDFKFVSANFPAIKQLKIKNTSNDSISISIHSSTPQLNVYDEETDDGPIIRSTSNSSVSSAVSIDELRDTVPQGKATMVDLDLTMKRNHQFFTNMFSFGGEESEQSLVEHYKWQYKEFNRILKTSLKSSLDRPITIPAGQRVHLWAVLVPEVNDRTLLWTHKCEELSIDLISSEVKIPPNKIPIRYNVASSSTFITSHNLNFGTVVRKTTKVSNIYLTNESTLPLLYKIKTNKQSNVVTVVKDKVGIVPPLDNRLIPIRFETPNEGNVHEVVTIKNILNPLDIQQINMKATVERRAGFFVDPLEIDFGEVQFGSSVTVPIYIKNIREEDATYTFSHIHRESNYCKPIISFQYQNMSESHLTAAVEMQLEKWKRKYLIEVRKNRPQRAEKIKALMEQLKKTSSVSENLQKRSTAKSIDRMQLQSGKLQTHCLRIQLIPSLKSKTPLAHSLKIEGTIVIHEHNRANSNKSIRYRAIIRPQQRHAFDDTGDKNISISPEVLNLGTVFVQKIVQSAIEVKNLSKTNSTPFWVSSEASADVIFTFSVNEGVLEPGQSLQIPFELFTTTVKEVTQYITITTPTSSQRCKISFESVYENVLSFPTLEEKKEINFGTISLTSLNVVEKRHSFDIVNSSDKVLFVNVVNKEKKHVVIYEHDPHFPIMQFIQIEPKRSVSINLMLKPDIDLARFKKYFTFVLDDSIIVTAFRDKNDAINALQYPAEIGSCVYRNAFPVTALIGRVGIHISEKTIHFGCVNTEKQTATISLRNKSTKIPLDIVCTTTQGLTCSETHFTLPGSKDNNKENKDIHISCIPTTAGLNSSKLILAAPQTPFQMEVNVLAFVDPMVLSVDLPRNERGFYAINVGQIYINKEKPIKKEVSFSLKNISEVSVSLNIPEINKDIKLRRGATTGITFDMPFTETDPIEEKKHFSYLLHFVSKLTKSIYQIVEVTGIFVVSNAHGTPFVDMGTIYSGNGMIKEKLNFNITNLSKADLFLDYESTEEFPFFDIPKVIGPVGPSKSIDISANAISSSFTGKSGEKTYNLIYRNRYNSANKINISVTMNILKTFLNTDFGNILHIGQFNEVATEDSTLWTTTRFFSVGNALTEETTVKIAVEETMPENVHVEILKKNSETRIDALSMQPDDVLELRAKITLLGEFSTNDISFSTKVATIVFSNEGYPPYTVDVVYSDLAALNALPALKPQEEEKVSEEDEL